MVEQGDIKATVANSYRSKIQPFNVDLKIPGAQAEIILGDRIIPTLHTPGHSPGSIVYLTESDGKKSFLARTFIALFIRI